MENNSIKNEPSTAVVEEIAITESTKPKHKNKGMLIGMIVLAVLAIGGISFGVWAMLAKNQETENYIYIGEWGVKIKKPEKWRTLIEGYDFYNGYPQTTDIFAINEASSYDSSIISINSGGECSYDNWELLPDACFEIAGDNIRVYFGDGVSDTMRIHFADEKNYSRI